MSDDAGTTIYVRRLDLDLSLSPIRVEVGTPLTLSVSSSVVKLLSATWTGDLENETFTPDRLSCTVTYGTEGKRRISVRAKPPEPGRTEETSGDVAVVFTVHPPSVVASHPQAPPPVGSLGTPEDLPDKTFISKHGLRANDKYLKYARLYHQEWDLHPIEIDSLEEIIEKLARAPAIPLERIRIVSHAFFTSLHFRLFKKSRVGITAAELEAWAKSDADGLLEALNGTASPESYQNRVLETLRRDRPEVLAPFGLDSGGSPQGPTATLIAVATDLLLNRSGYLLFQRRRRVPQLDEALEATIGALATDAGQGRQPSGADIRALSAAVLKRKNVFSRDDTIRIRLDGQSSREYFDRLTADVDAVRRNWRRKLDVARMNSPVEHVDIRGCAVGSTQSYLNAVASFFGHAQRVPLVSAPVQFQGFAPTSTKVTYIEDNDFDQIANDPPVQEAMLRWANAVGITSEREWPGDNFPNRQVARLSYYLSRAKVLPVGVNDFAKNPPELNVTFYMHPLTKGGVGTSGNREFDPDNAQLWLMSQWTPPPNTTVRRLVNQWTTGSSPYATAISNVLLAEATAVVASDPAFHARIRRSR